jgi:hypothetical protein
LTGHVTPDDIATEVGNIRHQLGDIKSQPVQNDDIGAPAEAGHVHEPPTLVGNVTPTDLEQALLSNGLTKRWLEPDSEHSQVYQLVLPTGESSRLSFNRADGVVAPDDYLRSRKTSALPVTFDRETWDASDDANLVFLTYGSPELAALLPRRIQDDV